MNRKLKKELIDLYQEPNPGRKEEFLRNFPYPKAKRSEFILTQLGYIRPRFWIVSLLLLIAVVTLVSIYQVTYLSFSVISSFLPFFVLVAMTEVNRSVSYNMEELERSCKYNYAMITMMKLAIIFSFHFLILSFSATVFLYYTEIKLFPYAIYCILPFLLCIYLSLFIANHIKSKDITYICAGVTGVVSIGSFATGMTIPNEWLLQTNAYILLIGLIIFSLVIYEIKFLLKRTEGLKCNSLSKA